MGLINPDVYTTNQGVQKANTYISFVGSQVNLRKLSTDASGVSTYEVNSIASIFWDEQARFSGKSSLSVLLVAAKLVGNVQLDQNLYGVLYARLKEIFPNAYDSLAREPSGA